jgi:F-type H+-transporting ATPase subunit a
MPEHHTWFDLLLGRLYKNIEHAIASFSDRAFEVSAGALGVEDAEAHGTWLTGGHVSAQHVFASAFVILILTGIGLSVGAKVKDTQASLVPEDRFTLRTFVELLVEATYGQLVTMMGPKAAKFFLPLIGTCAFLILFSNVLGLVPGFLPPTDVLNTTVPYALVIFFATHIFGVKEHGLPYFKHFLGPLWWLAPLMLPIEIVSHIVRPVSLAIRLAANMTGDHKVLSVFLGFVALIPYLFVVPVAFYGLGLLVSVVQTLVFCLLSAVYISLAIAHEEH